MRGFAFVGGTGPQGLGLAMRFAQAGEAVLIGSRSASRADEAARRIRAAVPGAVAEGVENRDAIGRAERIVLTLPAAVLPTFLETARSQLAGKLVIDVAVPVALRDGFFELAPVPGAPSAGELVQKAVPSARVVSAFKNVSAERLQDLSAALEGDVVLCGDDAAARTEVAALVAKLPGLRAVDAGRLANARYLEAITALLLNLNRRFRARTSIAIVGLG
ncbi:MAG: NADPH-dependent F420 reductase [Deltaproteobacteria bacterium]|nr:MAG: NADPH-dependent F420 reductase [Deltaproteobacteria bacterium]TMA68795.1 MAG: NADPH-dependent F420 reductase [Deltaproteobacteria bacterium]TMB40320.1 MAG: NADPH-dependent F420 reductase [Deltaproteobacteria bacterium]